MTENTSNATENVILEIIDPRGELAFPERRGLFAPRLNDLNGKKIAILAEGPDSTAFFNIIENMLKERYPAVDILYFPSMFLPNSTDTTVKIAEACDAWLDGVKATKTGGRHDTGARMEKHGKPGVSICTDTLLRAKKMQADNNGMPTCRIVTVPTTDYIIAKQDQDMMESVANAVFDDILKALIEPLTRDEQEVEDFTCDYSPKKFTGIDYAEANEKFQQYCAEKHMTDGMPVVPPTREAVNRMLAGTSYPPDKKIGLMFPKQGIATVEKIAINAVMAGAKPEYLPVIITIIETITAKDFNQYHIVNEILPIIFISGPIIEEIGLNNEIGYLAPGHRANSTIGRALLMCMVNIGWRDMSIYSSPGGPGQPAAYANYIVPENQKASPWEPFAVSVGFSPEESVVTVCEGITITRGPAETLSNDTFQQRLEQMGSFFSMESRLYSFFSVLSNVKDYRHMLAIHPTFARQLSNAGYTRDSFIQWLYDKNVIDWDKMSEDERERFKKSVAEGKFPSLKLEDCKPGLLMEPITDPRHVAIIVSGTGAGGTIIFQTPCGSTAEVEDVDIQRPFMHKVIHGATLTESGR